MKKKIGLMSIAIGLLVVSIIGGSIAYFRADTDAKNQITAGNLGVELRLEDEENLENIINNGLEVSGGLPGDVYDYPLYAYNDGDFDSYIRITLTKYWEDQNGKKKFDADASKILLGLNKNDWIVDESDHNSEVVYCYYRKPVSANGSTSHVVDHIQIANLTNQDQNLYSTLQVKVDVEVDAIQKVAAQDAMLAEWGLDVSFDNTGMIQEIVE